jgi:hypothetical protein
MKRSQIKRTIKHKDPVSREVYASVYSRDVRCVGPKVGMPGICGSQFGPQSNPPMELDHVNGSGLGKRGPSIPENLVLLCGLHHRMKTEQARAWRPVLNEYLKKVYER